MREILTDLVAEQQSFDQYLQKIPPRDWKKPVKAKGWSVQNLVAHLAHFEDLATAAVEDGADPMEEVARAGNFEALVKEGIVKGDSMRPQDVIEWWRLSRAATMDALWLCETDDRMPWFGGDLSAKLMATFRIMETWAHGLDVYDQHGVEVEASPRLRHVSFLGWKLLPVAYRQAGMEPVDIRGEVMGPNYSKWSFGPEGAPRIKGPALEWCRYIVQRAPLKDCPGLVAEGDDAEQALKLATAYITPE